MYLMYLTIILNSSGQSAPSPIVFTEQTISSAKCREVSRTLVAETKSNLPHSNSVREVKTVCKFIGNK